MSLFRKTLILIFLTVLCLSSFFLFSCSNKSNENQKDKEIEDVDVDDDVLDNLEEVLVTSDVGVDTTLSIINRIEERVARDKYVGTDELAS